MAVDQELERHQRTWIAFTRLMKWSIAVIILVVVILRLWTL
jgi:Bacterial aa3 type cytochrome c oxidase subunit IV